MRMTMTAPALAILMALSACAGSGGWATPENDPDQVCAEQSGWATQGRRDGRDITITCPAQGVAYSPATGTTHTNSYVANEATYRASNAAMIAVGAAN